MSLSDAELVAILLRTGNAEGSAVELAKKLLYFSDNSLNALSQKSLRELHSLKGVGNAKAVTLMAAFEIGRRMMSENVEQSRKILSAADVMALMQDRIAYLQHEEFWAIYLNNANAILKTMQLSKGGITNTAVDIRIILHEAISLNSTSFIVTHNHPSGNLKPSKADKEITKKICMAAATLDLAFIDHVVVNKQQYFSFVENNLL